MLTRRQGASHTPRLMAEVNAVGGFHEATFTSHIEVASILLEQASDPILSGVYGNTLAIATRKNHLELVRLLTRYVANSCPTILTCCMQDYTA